MWFLWYGFGFFLCVCILGFVIFFRLWLLSVGLFGVCLRCWCCGFLFGCFCVAGCCVCGWLRFWLICFGWLFVCGFVFWGGLIVLLWLVIAGCFVCLVVLFCWCGVGVFWFCLCFGRIVSCVLIGGVVAGCSGL